MSYQFKSRIVYETIEIDVLYDGSLIATRKYSTVTFTVDSAIEDLQFVADHFGFIGLDGSLYPATVKTPEPDTPINPVQENVDNVTSKLEEFNESITPDMFKFEIPMMDDKDVLKKQIITQSSSIPEERISDGTADQIVSSFPNNHPSLTFIKDKKKEVKSSLKQLGFKGDEIVKGTTQLTTETIAAFVTIGSSATIMPPGAGLPTAFSAVQGLFASVKAFQTKLNQIQPILEQLKYAEMLVNTDENTPGGAEGKAAIGSINTALGSINVLISGVAGIISPITQVQNILGSKSIPGIDGTPPQTIEWDGNGIWGTKSTLTQTEVNAGGEEGKVWINCTPIKGTWKYKFWWSSDNDPAVLHKNSQAVNVWPSTTTKYTVSARNEDGTGGSIWRHWTVTVT